ncbi:hypothetical protein EPN42_01495 [bacterium]|nr:MAG: hypothetical protein EPN42_01495 [bacterium]
MPATEEALQLLLADLPAHAHLLRFAPGAYQGVPAEIDHARALLTGDPLRPLPARVLPSVLARLPGILEHPSLRGRVPSVQTAVALLRGLRVGQADDEEELEATRTLARLLAAPFLPPLARRLELIAPTGWVGGRIRMAVGYDAQGSLTRDRGQIARPIAWLVTASADHDVFVLVSDCTVTLPVGAALGGAIGLVFDRDANVLRLVMDPAPSTPIVELISLRATRVEPLVGDGSGWIGRCMNGQLTRAEGPAPLGPILIDDAGRCVLLPGSRSLEGSLALACGVDPASLRSIVTQSTPIARAQVAWGPCALAHVDGTVLVAPCTPGERLPDVRLLVDDAPIAEGSSWSVLGLEEGVAMLGNVQDHLIGTRELPVSELPYRFRGTPQVGGELIGIH